MPDRMAAAAHNPLVDFGGGPPPQPGDYVWIRGIFKGLSDVKPDADCDVDISSSNTQYKVTVRQDMVVFYGPDWWPPQQDDVVVTEDGWAWRFEIDQTSGRVRAFTFNSDQGVREKSGADGEEWRGTLLIARGGKRVDY